jgi:Spy/CpxP family protein refolding chaperone
MKKHNIILAAIAAMIMSFGVMSCASDTNQANDITPASIMSMDSAQNPDGCLVNAEWLADTLNLTDEQVAILTATNDSLKAIAEAEIAAANGDRELIKAAIKKYREAMRAVVEATLTPEQLALLEALRPPFHGGRGTRGHHFGQHKHAFRDSLMLVELTTELGLSDSQVVQVKTLADSIKANGPGDGKRAFYEGMKLILTPEQLAKFEAWIAARPNDGKPEGPGHRGGHGRGRGRK